MKKKPICVILEGGPGVGKTTVSDYIYKLLSARNQKCFRHHFMTPKGEDTWQKVAYQKGQFELMFQTIEELHKLGTNVILDRSHIGEWVWSQLYRNYDPTYLYDLEERFKHLNIVTFRLTFDNPDVIISRLKERHNDWTKDDPFFNHPKLDMMTHAQQLETIDKKFYDACCQSIFPHTSIYTDNQFNKELKSYIKSHLEGYQQ